VSSASTTPFFGRAYSLTVTPTTGPSANTAIIISSDQFEPNALRFTFDITQYAFSSFWFAEITIYNCDGPISSGPSSGINLFQAIIQEGDLVTVSAGYQADYPAPARPPAIWTGQVFYTVKDRLDVVDQRLTLHCILSRALTTQNFINATLPARSTQFSQARFIAQKSITPIGINSSQVQSVLGSTQLPRGKSYFGNPHPYLTSLADQNNAVSWFDSHSWNTDSLVSPVGKLAATYAPVVPGGGPPARVDGTTLSLIGQPQQTQLGVNFRVLLDPNVQIAPPLPQVAIAQQFIRQAPIAYGTSLPPVPLVDQYVVVGVRFVGDTRGNPWYSDITGIAQIQTAIQLLGQSQKSDPTGN
jgi:hypothetical protein